MHRFCIPLVAACALLTFGPSTASAKITELGEIEETVKASCPDRQCRAVTRTTAYQAKVGEVRGPLVAPGNGRIVAFTLLLGKPGPKQRDFFTKTFGGAAQAAVVILRPAKNLNFSVIAKSDMLTLTDYFGKRSLIPLVRTLPVRKGDVVGLTVPTWAPMLGLGLEGTTSWRSSQAKDGCNDTQTQSGLLGSTTSAQFACLFRNQRLTYSATFIPNPS